MDKRTVGYKWRQLSMQKGTSVMLELLKHAKSAAIPAKYVLFDSWFSSPSSIHAVKGIGYDVIAIVKKTPKCFFSTTGKIWPQQPFTAIQKTQGTFQIPSIGDGWCYKRWKNHSSQSGLCPKQKQTERMSVHHFNRYWIGWKWNYQHLRKKMGDWSLFQRDRKSVV